MVHCQFEFFVGRCDLLLSGVRFRWIVFGIIVCTLLYYVLCVRGRDVDKYQHISKLLSADEGMRKVQVC